ncbi:retrotransposon protein, putative, ty1-copia subclass, partial [Tanacetum coccineum]
MDFGNTTAADVGGNPSASTDDASTTTPSPPGVITGGHVGKVFPNKFIDGTVTYDSNRQAFMVMPTSHRVALAEPAWRKAMEADNAFINRFINEEVYMQQPSGFEYSQRPQYVCKLHKAIYGLNQSPRAWFSRLTDKLFQLGFRSSKADTSLFVFHHQDVVIYMLVYVDDIVIMGSSQNVIDILVRALSGSFSIKDLGRYDTDWAGCLDYLSRSSIEAEYKALANATSEATWVQYLLKELDVRQSRPLNLWCDNLGATYLTDNLVFHARTKHIEVDFHFVREKVAMGTLDVRFISYGDHIEYGLTKP